MTRKTDAGSSCGRVLNQQQAAYGCEGVGQEVPIHEIGGGKHAESHRVSGRQLAAITVAE